MAKLLDLKNNYDKDMLKEASEYIREGKLVLFPTETVYGIGANALNEEAIKNIFIAKGRPQDDPLIVHVSSIDMVYDIVEKVTDIEKSLMDKFFPGPLTIVLPKKEIVPYITTGGLDTVGIRMPENIIAHDLIELSNTPIAAPSANISGRPSGTNIKDIFNELNDRVDYIIDGGDTFVGVESTVIRVIDGKINILRPGKITKEDFEKFGYEVIIDKHVLEETKMDEVVLSPGMKYKHYAPNTKCKIIYSSDNNKMINAIKKEENERALVVCKKDNVSYYNNAISYGNTLEEISHNLFSVLRNIDDLDYDLVIFEGVESKGLGLAIMNRLVRACSHNYINLD